MLRVPGIRAVRSSCPRIQARQTAAGLAPCSKAIFCTTGCSAGDGIRSKAEPSGKYGTQARSFARARIQLLLRRPIGHAVSVLDADDAGGQRMLELLGADIAEADRADQAIVA